MQRKTQANARMKWVKALTSPEDCMASGVQRAGVKSVYGNSRTNLE